MTSTRPFVTWSDPALERELLSQVSLDVPWSIVEQFSRLVRLSGSPDERRAVEMLMEHLRSWGVPHTLYEPVCFISIPLEATLRSLEPSGKAYRAKTVSMSVSTGGEEVTGELVYVPGAGGTQAGDVFSAGVDLGGRDVRGKIVLTEGMASPGKVNDVMNAGALAGIFINPGTYIHEGICTTIWGTPDLDSMKRQPNIPVLAVNNPDGQELIALAERGGRVALSTRLDTGWRPIPVLVAEIPGRLVPEEFVLVHGHLDSWHVGIGDNATGNATLLELARVFWQHRDRLRRTLRIAWWSGHSHGRYAGSTWYADTFAQDLMPNCIAHVNCDSPGCRWATEYRDVACMAEAGELVHATIRDVTGQESSLSRPLRAGDCSFNNLGITTYFMLSSTMPESLIREKGYYPVGGCGGNIQWHTEDDTIEIADPDNLLRDMRVYAAVLLRTLNAPVHPFDYRATVREIEGYLQRYQEAAGDAFDFRPALQAAGNLLTTLDRFYELVESLLDREVDDPEVRRVNAAQRALARHLVPLGYVRAGRFRHDPAQQIPPLPEIAPATELGQVPAGSDRWHTLRTHLARGQNYVVWSLRQAHRRIAEILP